MFKNLEFVMQVTISQDYSVFCLYIARRYAIYGEVGRGLDTSSEHSEVFCIYSATFNLV